MADLEAGLNVCRICLSDEDPESLIAPCLCAGTSKWVHRECLDEWRAQEQVPRAFTHCPTCKFEYEIEDKDEHRNQRLLRFRCLLCRDTCALFIAVQSLLALVGVTLHTFDSNGFIKDLYPHHWADKMATNHFTIGPYYCSAVIVCLAILGGLGVWMKFTNRLPQPPQRQAARHQVVDNYSLCCCCCPRHCYLGPTDPILCWGCDCEPCCRLFCCAGDVAGGGAMECCGMCASNAGECGACDLMSTAAGSGEAAAFFIPVLLVLLVLFALIGLVVGIFFVTVLAQRWAQRHVHLLQMRSEAQRFVVVDRAACGGGGGGSSSNELRPVTPSCSHCGCRSNTMAREQQQQQQQQVPGPARDV